MKLSVDEIFKFLLISAVFVGSINDSYAGRRKRAEITAGPEKSTQVRHAKKVKETSPDKTKTKIVLLRIMPTKYWQFDSWDKFIIWFFYSWKFSTYEN